MRQQKQSLWLMIPSQVIKQTKKTKKRKRKINGQRWRFMIALKPNLRNQLLKLLRLCWICIRRLKNQSSMKNKLLIKKVTKQVQEMKPSRNYLCKKNQLLKNKWTISIRKYQWKTNQRKYRMSKHRKIRSKFQGLINWARHKITLFKKKRCQKNNWMMRKALIHWLLTIRIMKKTNLRWYKQKEWMKKKIQCRRLKTNWNRSKKSWMMPKNKLTVIKRKKS